MNWQVPHVNLVMAWFWILAGFGSGAMMGLRFAREHWLGGYTSLRRRMYRLGHISFFGLGFVNLMFYLTCKLNPGLAAMPLTIAAWAFVLGAVTMPISCVVLAHQPNARPPLLFALPVTSLLAGVLSTLWMLLAL